MTLESLGLIVTIIVAAGGLFAWITSRFDKAKERELEREKAHADELRVAEVAAWAAETIASAQTIVVAFQFSPSQIDKLDRRARIRDAAFKMSVSIEQGRMFFKNCVIDEHGADKEPAYRGYRPRVLDPLVVLSQAACRHLAEGDDPDCRLLAVAEDAARQFVSLIQAEIGRSRAASADTSAGGDGANLDYLLARLPAKRLERICPGPR